MQYKAESIDRVRDAIKQRTDALGIEKSKVSAEAIKAAEERARARIADGGFQALDLSQITTQASSSSQDENSIFFEPEEEMSEEEIKEGDPVGQLSIQEQVKAELSAAIWPTFGAAMKKAGIILIIGAVTCFFVVEWNDLVRDLFMNVGLIPRPEDFTFDSEKILLPEGWADGMTDEDVMKFQEEFGYSVDAISSSVSSVIDSGFSDL